MKKYIAAVMTLVLATGMLMTGCPLNPNMLSEPRAKGLFSLECRGCVPVDTAYQVREKQTEHNYEYQFFHENHHFMTLLENPDGAVALRPHPGTDVNGWGSTWYVNAFLPPGELRGGSVDMVEASDTGIVAVLSGTVARGAAAAYGTWSCEMTITDDRAAKIIEGTGNYTVSLTRMLNPETGDLNLGRIASNYLTEVPLLGGGTGDTGDMTQVDATGGHAPSYDFQFTWSPPAQPAHYPSDTTDRLSIHVSGAHNLVDTAAMGYASIADAYKPSLHVTLASGEPGADLTFGAAYTLDHARDFWEDNVGVTPLIRVGNPHIVFQFDLSFSSAALPEDGN